MVFPSQSPASSESFCLLVGNTQVSMTDEALLERAGTAGAAAGSVKWLLGNEE
jgi:hypothetical protein